MGGSDTAIMFGTLYEPPSLTLSGLFILFAIQICAIFVYKQAQAYYRNQHLYQYYGRPLPVEKEAQGPAVQAPGGR